MTAQNQPIEVFYAPTPNGQKITIMLEELGVPYVVRSINIGKGDQFRPEFLAISPNSKIPAIIDPEGPGGAPISIFESGAILKYLALKFEQFYPTDARAQAKVDEWLFWQMGGFGPMLGQNHHFAIYAPEKIPYAIKRYVDETHRLYRVLDKQLANSEYVAGAYSIADIAIIGWSNGYEGQGIDITEFPHFATWHARVNARPAVRKALAIVVPSGGALDLANDKSAQSVLFNQRGN